MALNKNRNQRRKAPTSTCVGSKAANEEEGADAKSSSLPVVIQAGWEDAPLGNDRESK